MKRVGSIVLVLVLLLSAVPGTCLVQPVQAAEAVVIRTARELYDIRENLAGSYVLGADIDLAGFGPWTPIGTYQEPFTGSLDGNGHTISNLEIDLTEAGAESQYLGLFGRAEGAQFADLTLENVSITSQLNKYFYVGGLVGWLEDGAVARCHSGGCIRLETASSVIIAGGVAGYLYNTPVTDCTNTAAITAKVESTSKNAYAGGIAGQIRYGRNYAGPHAVSGCFNSGKLYGEVYAGGITGQIENTGTQQLELYGCENTADVETGEYGGGITGHQSAVSIRSCTNAGDLDSSFYHDSNHYLGGIAGYSKNAAISGCSNHGDAVVDGQSGPYTGGIVGYLTGGSVELCSNTGDMEAISVASYNAFSGGIAAMATGSTIRRCYSSGSVTAHAPFKSTSAIGGYLVSARGGGIAGILTGTGSGSVVEDCYNTGSIFCSTKHAGWGGYYGSRGNVYAGGVVGQCSNSKVNRCYSTGEPTAVNINDSADVTRYEGAICAVTSADNSVTDCYFSKIASTHGVGGSTSEPDAHGLSIAQLRKQASFSGFDFSNIWVMEDSYPYPSLRNNRHEGTVGPTAVQVRVPSGKYVIHVVNEHGVPLEGASVVWQDSSQTEPQMMTTDANGDVFLTDGNGANPMVGVSLEGYLSWDNSNAAWEKNSRKYETVVLYPRAYGGLRLESAVYQCGLLKTDLLTETKRVALPCEISDQFLDLAFEVTCEANDTAQAKRYELWQKDQLIRSSPMGTFAGLKASDFGKGKGCFIRVIDEKGRSMDTPVNLEFAETKINEKTAMSLMDDKITFSLGDEIPYLGGTTVEIDFPNVPINFQIDDEKIYLGINLDLNPKEGETVRGKAEELSKALDAWSYATGLGKGRLYDRTMRECYLEDLRDCSLPTGDYDISVVGYGEGDLGSTMIQAEVYLVIEGEAPLMDSTTLVPIGPVVVPVTFQVEVEAEARGGLHAQYDWTEHQFSSGLDLMLSVELDVFGGLGVGDLLGAGAYGSAEVKGEAELIGDNPGVEYIDLTGELGVRAYLGPLSAEKAFVYQTWHLYTRKGARQLSLAADSAAMEQLIEAADYYIESLDYLEAESDWLGGEAQTLDLLADEIAMTELLPLLEGTYRNAQPVMIEANGALYAAFVRGDAQTGDTFVACTKFDGESWCEPVTAAVGGCSEPQLAVDADGRLHLAYVYTGAGFDGQTLKSYAENRSVAAAMLDPDTLEVTDTTVFERSNCYDPKLAAVGARMYLLCRNSPTETEEAILQPTEAVICQAELTAASPVLEPLTDEGAMILSYTAGVREDAAAAGCIVDEDGNPVTTGDRALVVLQQDEQIRLAEAVGTGVSFGRMPGTADSGFLWTGENLLCSEYDTVSAPGITDEFAVVGDRVYYSTGTGGSANLMVLQYRDGDWSLPVQLTDQAYYLEDLNVAACDGTDYLLGMQTMPTIGETTLITEKNLVWARAGAVADLAVDGIEYDPGSSTDGKTAITLSVINAGTLQAEGIRVLQDGTAVHTAEGSLEPGEVMELAFWVDTPAELTDYQFAVEIQGQQDHTPENNRVELQLGQGDLAVELAHQQIGLRRSLLVITYNKGTGPASGNVQLSLENGESLAEIQISELAPGETSVSVLELEDRLLADQNRDVTAAAVADGPEFFLHNNTDTIHLTQTVYINTIESVTLTETVVGVTASSEGTAELYCAVYDQNGRMTELHRAELERGVHTLEFPRKQSAGTTVGAFLLGDGAVPLAPAKKSE